jgi:hypothetical protein
MTSPAEEYFAELGAALRTDAARTAGLSDVFEFRLSGPAGGTWWIETSDGTGAVHEGEAQEPAVSIRMSDETFLGLANGQVDGAGAFYDGLMTAEGGQSKMFRLGQLFGG